MKEQFTGKVEMGRDLSSYTWYGVSKILFIRLTLAALLFCAGLFLPENTWTVFLMVFSFLISGYDIVTRAVVRLVKDRVLGEELLITVCVILAFTINESYDAAAVMLIYQIGYILRTYAVELTRGNLRERVDPYPMEVTLQQGEDTISVAPEQLQTGDVLILQAGERLTVNCTVLEGASEVEMAGLLGRSRRRKVSEGEAIPAGAVNLASRLRVRVDSAAEETTLAKVLDVASDEELCRGSTQEDVERYAAVYAPFALGIGILIALLLLIFTRSSAENAIHRALVALVVACPTAFLAPVPLMYLAGLYRSVRSGVLVKGASMLDGIARIGAVILDKDDMLATGRYRVLAVKSERMDPNMLLSVAAHAQAGSSTPIAASILSAYEGIIDHSLVSNLIEEEGGLTAEIDDVIITMGSREFMEEKGVVPEDHTGDDLAIHVALNGRYAGCILLADLIRDDAESTVLTIESTGADCILLSEDSEENTRLAASAVGIREYYAQCMPLERLEKIQEIKERFPSNSVLYLGNGVNDSASLSAADIGVCVNGLTSETALQTGSVVVMDSAGAPLADAVDAGRITRRTVRSTLLAILLVKALLLVLSLLGVTYQLWFAMLVDVVAGIAGVLISARILDK